MSSQPPPGPFLPPVWQYPEQAETVKAKVEAREAKTAYYLNQREVANYALEVQATGQQWPPTSPTGQPRYSLRKIVAVGPLVAGANTYAHGIAAADLQVVTRLYGALSNVGITTFLPLPYVSSPPGAEIQLDIVGGNVVLTTPIPYPGYSGYVVIEYLTS